MAISVDNPQFFYQLMYALTFAFIFSVVIYRSIKLGYPLRTILLMLATITLFIIIGTRLITIPLDQWISAIGSENASHTNRSSIGGIVFGLAGLLISLKLFKHKRPILKLFAWVVPLGLAIAKLGCLFNGCCYGLAFNGFWSIQYPVTTNAHYNHWHSGAIANDAMQSLAVHPVQLYESLILVIIGIVVWKTHKIWKRSLSAVLFALFLYFTLRFGVEFFRDHSVSQFGNQHYLGVWLYQWVMLGIGILMGVWLWLNESIVFKHSIKSKRTWSFNHIELTFVASLTVLIYLFQNLLKPFELLVVWSIFIPAVTLFLYAIFRENNVINHRKIVIASLFAPFFVMAQTMPDQKYHRIDVGGSFGNFANEVKF
ncbi:prolipoprotein diacylglyceryl transferase, partial [Aegicerativicinus sediminis]